MASKSKIEWTATRNEDGSLSPGSTWNPIRGTRGAYACEKVSPACAHCYAERLNLSPRIGVRLSGNAVPFVPGADEPRLHEDTLQQPMRWQEGRKVFVCSMTDLFWSKVPDAWIDRIWATMLLAPQHTYLILTKRPERMRRYLLAPERYQAVLHAANVLRAHYPRKGLGAVGISNPSRFPRPHIWLGTTIESEAYEYRLDALLGCPAHLRFVSVEPMLGDPDWLIPYLDGSIQIWPEGTDGITDWGWQLHRHQETNLLEWRPGIAWVITGGESGGPAQRALVEPCSCGRDYRARCTQCDGTGWRLKEYARRGLCLLRDWCELSGIAFFHKQNGGPRPTSAGKKLNGRECLNFPDARWRPLHPIAQPDGAEWIGPRLPSYVERRLERLHAGVGIGFDPPGGVPLDA